MNGVAHGTRWFSLNKAGAAIWFLCVPAASIQAAWVTLEWDPSPSSGVAGYYLYWRTNSPVYSPANRITVTRGTEVTVSNLVLGATYYFVVTAYNSAGLESDFSNEITHAVPSGAPVPSYPVTVLAAPAQGGTVTGAGSYADGLQVTVSATANTGYSFANWTERGEMVSSSASHTFALHTNRDLVANFTRAQTGGQNGAWVLGKRLGSLRNDFDGWVGLKLEVAAQPIRVTALGRICVGGNTRSHALKLVRALDKTDVPGSTVTVSMMGATAGQFRYGQLTSPVMLAANTVYYLVSREVRGGDQWYHCAGTLLTVDAVATVLCGVYAGGGYPWTEAGQPGESFVPLDLVCASPGSPTTAILDTTTSPGSNLGPPTSFITSVTPGQLRFDAGRAGMQFTAGADPLVVTGLGRMMAPGNSLEHLVKLVGADDLQDVPGGSVTVSMAGGTVGQFKYADLVQPVVLAPHTTFFLVSDENWFADGWYDADTVVTTRSVATCDGAGYLWYGWADQAGPNTVRGPVDFKYCVEDRAGPEAGETGATDTTTAQSAPVMQVCVRGGQMRSRIIGEAGWICDVQSSSDFRDWTKLVQVILSDGTAEFDDADWASHPHRFYRAVLRDQPP